MSRTDEETIIQLAISIAAKIEQMKQLFTTSEIDVDVLARIVFPFICVRHTKWIILLTRLDPSLLGRIVSLSC